MIDFQCVKQLSLVTPAALACLLALAPQAKTQGAPCCSITAIDPRAATATAKVNVSGQTFQFRANDPKFLSSMKVGQVVYANFKTKQVSLDSRQVCCTITAGPSSSGQPTTTSQSSNAMTGPGPLIQGRSNSKPEYSPVGPAVGCVFLPAIPDLAFRGLGFNSTRHVTYTVENCGRAATQMPFIVDLFVNDERRDTVEHQPLAALSEQSVTSQLAQHQGCDPVRLKAVVDPQQIVVESNEGNNVRLLEITPPCPDLAVDEIKQDWEDANTRYTVQVKVGNHGNGPSEVTVIARVSQQAGVSGTPTIEDHEIPPLAVGQSFIFHCDGKHLATTATNVDILVDIYKQLVESNRDNNKANKTVGPH